MFEFNSSDIWIHQDGHRDVTCKRSRMSPCIHRLSCVCRWRKKKDSLKRRLFFHSQKQSRFSWTSFTSSTQSIKDPEREDLKTMTWSEFSVTSTILKLTMIFAVMTILVKIFRDKPFSRPFFECDRNLGTSLSAWIKAFGPLYENISNISPLVNF